MNTSCKDIKDIAELRNTVVALARRLRQSVKADSENWTTLMALGAIQRADGAATPTQVASDLNIHSSNAAQVLGELERRQLVLRTPDHSDKRKVRLSLTQAGNELVYASRARRDQWLADAMEACLTVEEQEQLIAAGELLRRVASWNNASSQSSV